MVTITGGGFSNISGQISPNPSLDDNDSKFLDFDMDGDLDMYLLTNRLHGSEESRFITPEIIRNFCIAGQPEEVVEMLQGLAAEGLDAIKAAATENELDGVLVCACSERANTDEFLSLGFSTAGMYRVPFREHCTWSHEAGDEGQEYLILSSRDLLAIVG